MNTEHAVTETSAISTEAQEATEVKAAETVESATTEKEAQEAPQEKPSETTEKPGSEPKKEKELGDKGNAEIRNLRKRTQAAEREAAYQRGRAEALAEVTKGGKPAETANANEVETQFAKQHPKPQADHFETTAEFHEALTDWKLDLRDWKRDQSTSKTRETESQQELTQRLETQRTRGEEKYEDFQEVVSEVDFHPATLAAITASEIGEDVAYHLANNPKELARIEKLSPFLQAKEVGRIEAGIESGKIMTKPVKEPAKEVKRISTAPEPAPRVKSAAPVNQEAEYMSDSTSTARRIELSKARRAQQT